MKSKYKSRVLIYSVLAVITVLSIFLRGYTFGTSNHSFYIPLINKINNPDIFTKDLLFSFEFKNTFFYHIYAFLSQFVSLESLFFVSYIVASFLLILAVFKLAKYLFANDFIALLAAILLIIPKPSFGGSDATFYAFFYYNDLSVAILLFSILYFLKEKYVWAFVLLAVVFNFHALAAVHVFGLFAFYLLYDVLRRYKFDFITFIKSEYFRKLLKAIGLFVILVVPLFIFKSQSDSIGSMFQVSDPEWLGIQELRNSHHIFPSTFKTGFKKAAGYLVLGLISIVYLFQQRKLVPKSSVHRTIFVMSCCFLLYMLLGFVFVEVIPVNLFVLFQLFRSTIFLMIFAVIYGSYFIYQLLKSKEVNLLILTLLVSSVFLADYYWLKISLFLFIPIAALSILPFNKLKNLDKNKLCNFLFIVGIIIGSFFIDLNKENLPAYHGYVFLSFLIGLFFLGRKNISVVIKKYLVLSLLIIVTILSYSKFSIRKQDAYWIDMQLWTKENVKIDESIIVPPYMQGFRVYSDRNIYGDWKDGTMAFFSERFAKDWLKRMKDIGMAKKDYYNKLEYDQIKSLSTLYDQSYIVFGNEKTIDMPLLYKNKKFSIYRID